MRPGNVKWRIMMEVLSQTTLILMLFAYIAGLITAIILLSSRSYRG